jgi:transcriptional regulator with XRE-family HTH domain
LVNRFLFKISLRRATGLTREEVEARLGTSPHYLSGLKRGKRNPAAIVIDELAQALEVSHLELLQSDAIPDS